MVPRKKNQQSRITATIQMADEAKLSQLLCAFYAVHDHHSHDEDDFILTRPDGSLLALRASISYLEWRRPGEANGRYTENIDLGQIKVALSLFIAGDDHRLAEFPWLTPP
jgi:hypothetical protein